jgi:AcrR family transcriptional regulator
MTEPATRPVRQRCRQLTPLNFRVTVGRMESGTIRRQYNQVARAESRKRTRDALLHAAVERFLADRWDQATIEAIAADAGVTKQTLLRHFGSKAGLFEQAMLRDYEQVREQRFAVPRGDLGAAVDNLLDHYEAWSGYAVRIADAAADSEALAALRGLARQLHYDWVEHAFGPWLDARGAVARSRLRNTLIAICDLNAWRLLSHDLALSRQETRATLLEAIERLIEDR